MRLYLWYATVQTDQWLTRYKANQGIDNTMLVNGKRVLLCDCEGTMTIDAKGLAKACGADGEPMINTQLCRSQLANFEQALSGGEPVLVCCTQEAPLFLETADGHENSPELRFTNIRERAGWSKAGREKPKSLTPKLSALIHEATLDIRSSSSVTMSSDGVLLVLGTDQRAIDAAHEISDRLDVTVILTGKADDIDPPAVMDIPIFRGEIVGASGHLGAFEIGVSQFVPANPASIKALVFDGMGQSGASECDLILDLRGGVPLFNAPEKRDGYFNPDPDNPALIMKALLALTDMVGEFEKPRYVDYDPKICAHSRNSIVGCSRCVDLCPAGAIVSAPKEDRVTIDPYICGGCGICAGVCPTGAARYTLPEGDTLYRRLQTVLSSYSGAGGEKPVLLVHDSEHGQAVTGILARQGDGLPANIIPFTVNQTPQIGLDFLVSASAFGASSVVLLADPKKADEAEGLRGEVTIAQTVMDGLGYEGSRFHVLDSLDPDHTGAALADLANDKTAPKPAKAGNFLAMGRKRTILNLALAHLHDHAPVPVNFVNLPVDAPFGTVSVDIEGCTLCMSCVGACPTGALKDNPEKPQLSFTEDACVQCGLCRNTCPENVITLVPRLSFLTDSRSHHIIKEEEPFECIRCGKAFGARSSIEKMVEKLSGHSMFAEGNRIDMLRMCDDCRVISQMEVQDNPLAGAERPKTRTTDDDLREREILRQQAKLDMAKNGLIDPADDT